MKNSLYSITEIFEGHIIRIPAYQRGYSWEAKQLEELWKDVMNLVYVDGQKLHFTGILVFEELESYPDNWVKEISDFDSDSLKPISLVDGQQRLTTIIILLYVLIQKIHPITLRRYLGLEDKIALFDKFLRITHGDRNLYLFGYEIDTPSHQYLLNTIFDDESVLLDEPETVYTQNLKFAKYFFEDKLKDYETSKTQIKLLEILLNQLKFSRLMLKSSDIDISMVFETLNFRGKPLSYLELLKNRILYLLAQNKKKVRNYKKLYKLVISTWLEIYECLGKIDKKWINEDEFLRSFWLIYFDHSKRVKGEFNDFVEDIFNKRFPISGEKYEYLEYKSLKDLLKALSASIKGMYYIHNPSRIDEIKDDSSSVFYKLKDQRIVAFIHKLNELKAGWQASKNIVCAYLISSYYNSKELLEIIELLEKHNFLVYNLYGKKSDTSRAYMFRFANKVFGNKLLGHKGHIEVVESWIEAETNNYSSISNFIHRAKAKNKRFFDWIGIDYLIREYERYLISEQSIYHFEPLKKYKKVTLYNPIETNYGFGDFPAGSLKENFAYSLGNIFLAPSRRKLGNFSEILFAIQKDGTISEREIIGESYDADFIYKRGLTILKFISKRWGAALPFGNEVEMKRILFDAQPPKLDKEIIDSFIYSVN